MVKNFVSGRDPKVQLGEPRQCVRLILQHFLTPHFGQTSCSDCILIVVEIDLYNIPLYSCDGSDHVCFFLQNFSKQTIEE